MRNSHIMVEIFVWTSSSIPVWFLKVVFKFFTSCLTAFTILLIVMGTARASMTRWGILFLVGVRWVRTMVVSPEMRPNETDIPVKHSNEMTRKLGKKSERIARFKYTFAYSLFIRVTRILSRRRQTGNAFPWIKARVFEICVFSKTGLALFSMTTCFARFQVEFSAMFQHRFDWEKSCFMVLLVVEFSLKSELVSRILCWIRNAYKQRKYFPKNTLEKVGWIFKKNKRLDSVWQNRIHVWSVELGGAAGRSFEVLPDPESTTFSYKSLAWAIVE